MKVIIREEQFKRVILKEQIEPTTITSKEILKLGKKEGWESGTAGYPISQIVKLDTEFYTFDAHGTIEGPANMASENLFNMWRKENGLDPRVSGWIKKLIKKEPGQIYIKTLFPVSKFNK